MYIHHDSRLIYLAHPRTASVATATALQHIGFVRPDHPSDHHSHLRSSESPVTPGNRKEWTAFTTVRNHWDTAVSWVFRKFSTRGGEPRTWEVDAFELAIGESNRWVHDREMWWLHYPHSDVILRFERLDRDLSQLLRRFHLPVPAIPVRNASEIRAGRSYREFYTPATRSYIADKFSAEIEDLGYSF